MKHFFTQKKDFFCLLQILFVDFANVHIFKMLHTFNIVY